MALDTSEIYAVNAMPSLAGSIHAYREVTAAAALTGLTGTVTLMLEFGMMTPELTGTVDTSGIGTPSTAGGIEGPMRGGFITVTDSDATEWAVPLSSVIAFAGGDWSWTERPGLDEIYCVNSWPSLAGSIYAYREVAAAAALTGVPIGNHVTLILETGAMTGELTDISHIGNPSQAGGIDAPTRGGWVFLNGMVVPLSSVIAIGLLA